MLLAEEYRKCIHKRKSWLVLLGLLILTFFLERIPVQEKHGFSEDIYRYYVKQVEGAYSEEKESFLRSEQSRYLELLDLHDEMNRRYRCDEITLEEFIPYMDSYYEAKNHLPVVDYLVEKCDYYQLFSAEGKAFFYELDWERFFEKMRFDYIPAGMILLCILPIFSMEYTTGSMPLVLTSKYGRSRTYCTKLALAMGLTFCFSLCYYGIRFGLFYIHTGGAYGQEAVLNILNRAHLTEGMTKLYVKESLIRSMLWSYLAAAVGVGAVLTKNTTTGMMLGVLVLFVPVLLAGYLPRESYYVCSGLRLASLRSVGEKSLLLYGIVLIKLAGITWLGNRLWCRQG